MTFKRLLYVLPAIAALLLTFSCGDDDNKGISWGNNGGGGTVTPSRELTSRMETPRVLTDGSTTLIGHFVTTGGAKTVLDYSVEYDTQQYHSRWVAFRFDGDTRAKNVSRPNPDPFADDPLLASQYHIGSNGFGWDYNRGHLCASADRLFSLEACVQTFYMTNMSPQLGSFNQGYWITLENLIQNKGRNASFADTLYVVKGGTILSNQINGYITRSNGKKVAIPKYYFTALLKVKNGVYSSIAFWMEHKEYGYTYNSPAPLSEIKKTVVSVNRLEQLTGIDFFPNLPDDKEEIIEDQNVPGSWGM